MQQFPLGVDSRFVSMFVAVLSIRNQITHELAIGFWKNGYLPAGRHTSCHCPSKVTRVTPTLLAISPLVKTNFELVGQF